MRVLVKPPLGREIDSDVFDQLCNAFENVHMRGEAVLVDAEDVYSVQSALPYGYSAQKIKLKPASKILLDDVRYKVENLNNERTKAARRGEKVDAQLEDSANQAADFLIAFHRAAGSNFNHLADKINNNVKIFGAVGIAIPLLCGTMWMGYQVSEALQKMTPRRDQNIQDIQDNLGYTPESGAWTETETENVDLVP